MSTVRIVTDQLERGVARLMTTLSVNIVAGLQQQPPAGTPVDTGWARANWVPQIGSPYVVEASRDPAGVGSRAAEQQAGIASLFTYRLNRGPIFISNNAPYITRLNDGSSKQSPAGFVQAAIAREIAALDGVVIR